MRRYLGDRTRFEVHDTHNKRPGCRLAGIASEHRAWFNSVHDAQVTGYDRCAHCLGPAH